MNIQALLTEKISHAFVAAGIFNDCKPQVSQSTKIQFGHYQANGIISATKKLGLLPSQIAEKVLTYLNLDGVAYKIEIAGPGFINIFLDHKFLANQINIALTSEYLGVSRQKAKTIVVDYSSPNVAKKMHVGHLRSTIIGDAVVRTLEFLGHKVIRANHIGDWGTQFGMLITYLKRQQKNIDDMTLTNLEEFYCDAKKIYDTDKKFAQQARSYVVKLQRGEDQFVINIWRKLVDITMSENQAIYDLLNVTLTPNDVMGESLYNSMLPAIVDDLKKKGLAVENNGAIVVFLEEYKNKKGNLMGVVIQKKDGGYLYTTTDIACAYYRYKNLHADRIIYYVDARQHRHLLQVMTIVRKAGYVPSNVLLEHHMLGMMLNKEGKPFKTREGGTIKLSDLLSEALNRARCLIRQKNPHLSAKEQEKIAEAIGIGALKYSDLSKNRVTDYIFDWDSMLLFEGNTAPYIQYAYTRILSIFRKININDSLLASEPIIIYESHEVQLAVRLLQFEETLLTVAKDGTPHVMCSYLYDLATFFSSFYEHCPIILAKNIRVRNSRLKLAKLTAKTLKKGLNILGIKTVTYM